MDFPEAGVGWRTHVADRPCHSAGPEFLEKSYSEGEKRLYFQPACVGGSGGLSTFPRLLRSPSCVWVAGRSLAAQGQESGEEGAQGAACSCAFLELPEAPDAGSLFPLFSGPHPRVRGATHVPLRGAAPIKVLPPQHRLPWKGRLCLHSEHVPREAHLPPPTHGGHFARKMGGHPVTCHFARKMEGHPVTGRPLLPTALPTAMSLAGTPATEHWLAGPQTPLSISLLRPRFLHP